MPIIATAALAVAAGTALGMYLYGRAFSRRYVELHRRVPPPTWLFRRTQDGALEYARKRALILLPILAVAAVLYILNA